MARLKEFYVELTDDFSNRPQGGRKNNGWPHYKAWRIWIGSHFIAHITKYKEQRKHKQKMVTRIDYKIVFNLSSIAVDHYKKDKKTGKMIYMRDAKDSRKLDGYETLSDAIDAVEKYYTQHINSLIK